MSKNNRVPAIHSKQPLLTPQKIVVADVGENVTVTIGNSTLTMPYEAALQISQMIRLHAKRAKQTAGDLSRNWRVAGKLDELDENGDLLT